VETALDPHNAPVRAYLNADLKQSSSTANFIFDVPYRVSFITRIMPLFPGDIIATGTPSGIGPMKPGDTIEIEIEGIGRLRNTVTRQS
jgi:2-keto-4-pentenoate hydratase/2-oxohepta-3-ene-1,7-dioic acid hydratase in catechol pathway